MYFVSSTHFLLDVAHNLSVNWTIPRVMSNHVYQFKGDSLIFCRILCIPLNRLLHMNPGILIFALCICMVFNLT